MGCRVFAKFPSRAAPYRAVRWTAVHCRRLRHRGGAARARSCETDRRHPCLAREGDGTAEQQRTAHVSTCLQYGGEDGPRLRTSTQYCVHVIPIVITPWSRCPVPPSFVFVVVVSVVPFPFHRDRKMVCTWRRRRHIRTSSCSGSFSGILRAQRGSRWQGPEDGSAS